MKMKKVLVFSVTSALCVPGAFSAKSVAVQASTPSQEYVATQPQTCWNNTNRCEYATTDTTGTNRIYQQECRNRHMSNSN